MSNTSVPIDSPSVKRDGDFDPDPDPGLVALFAEKGAVAFYRPACVYCEACGRYIAAYHAPASNRDDFPPARFAIKSGCICHFPAEFLVSLLDAQSQRDASVVIYLAEMRQALCLAGATADQAREIEADTFPFAEERRLGFQTRLDQLRAGKEAAA